jgi:lipopolysaccharide/colanic/teichoic acid biosynthesis glycosyltransferase
MVGHVRHTVQPGLTGDWQIARDRSDLIHENLHLDEYYVENLGLVHDVAVLFRTPVTVFQRVSVGRPAEPAVKAVP